jgi:hypothetical protein
VRPALAPYDYLAVHPSLADILFSDRPACQCSSISVTSITSNVLPAIGLPSQTRGEVVPLDGQAHQDTRTVVPMGKYVIEVGNYMSADTWRRGSQIVWRIRGEVKSLAAPPQVSRHMTAVCKTVGSTLSSRWSTGQSNASKLGCGCAPEWLIWAPHVAPAPCGSSTTESAIRREGRRLLVTHCSLRCVLLDTRYPPIRAAEWAPPTLNLAQQIWAICALVRCRSVSTDVSPTF